MNIELTAFQSFPKMARLSRECIITEKLDGTNAQIFIVPTYEVAALGDLHSASLFTAKVALDEAPDLTIFAGSRTRWIQPGFDNYGFAAWVKANATELAKLGLGRHFGEWWGAGIQRRYGLSEKRFSLFNAQRWGGCPQNGWKYVQDLKTGAPGPSCCSVVPILYRGEFHFDAIADALGTLRIRGSVAAPGFQQPEGIVVYHIAAGIGFKKTLDGDAAKGVTLTDEQSAKMLGGLILSTYHEVR